MVNQTPLDNLVFLDQQETARTSPNGRNALYPGPNFYTALSNKVNGLVGKAKKLANDSLMMVPVYVTAPFGVVFMLQELVSQLDDGHADRDIKGEKMTGIEDLLLELVSELIVPDFTSTKPNNSNLRDIANNGVGLIIDVGSDIACIPLDLLDTIFFRTNNGNTYRDSGKSTIHSSYLRNVLMRPIRTAIFDASASAGKVVDTAINLTKAVNDFDISAKANDVFYSALSCVSSETAFTYTYAMIMSQLVDMAKENLTDVLSKLNNNGLMGNAVAKASTIAKTTLLPLMYDHRSFNIVMSRLNQAMASTDLGYVTTEPSMLHPYSALAGGQLAVENEARERTLKNVASLIDLYTTKGMSDVINAYVNDRQLLSGVLDALENYVSLPLSDEETMKKLINGFEDGIVVVTINSLPNLSSKLAVVKEFSASLTVDVDPYITLMTYGGSDVTHLSKTLVDNPLALSSFLGKIGYVGRREGHTGSMQVSMALDQEAVYDMVKAYNHDSLIENMFEEMNQPATPYIVISEVAFVTKDMSLVAKAAEFYTALAECGSLDAERLEYFGQSINSLLTDFGNNALVMHHIFDTLNTVVQEYDPSLGKSVCSITEVIHEMDDLTLRLQDQFQPNSKELSSTAEEQFCDLAIRYCALD